MLAQKRYFYIVHEMFIYEVFYLDILNEHFKKV